MGMLRSKLGLSICAAFLCKGPVVESIARQAPADAAATLAPIREKFKAPALAGAVIKDGKVIAIGVTGVRALGKGVPATLQDRWPIGSCSKPMARIVAARLADRGVWELDDSLGKLLPTVAMRDEYKPATLTDLVSHRAGIRPYTEIGPAITPIIFELAGSPVEQRATFTAHVLSEEPAAPPRTKFVYSNAGFCILATAAEERTGLAWDALVKNEVFIPLGLNSAVVGSDPDPGNAVRGHRKMGVNFRVQPQARQMLAVMAPAGGVCLNIEDFARFAAAETELGGGRPAAGISAKTIGRLPALRPADAPAKAGAGETFFGGDGFFTAAFAVWPEQRLAIVAASNAGDSDDLCAAAIKALRVAYANDAPVPGGKAGEARYGFQVMAEDQDAPWRVESVEEGSIADKAGLKAGDVIVAMNGTEIAAMKPDERLSAIRKPSLKLRINRDGKTLNVELMKPN